MELVCRKYSNLKNIIKSLEESQGDVILDLVYATEIGFVENHNKRDFYHSHLFCYHYCIDKYQNDVNVSFMILDANQQTGQYCFWDYKSDFYKENAKTKKLQIENALISVPFEKVSYGQDKFLFEIVEEIKKDMWDNHNNTLALFKEKNISYDESMDLFSQELKSYIDISYDDLFKLELAQKIKQYEAQVLGQKLEEKPIARKTVKI